MDVPEFPGMHTDMDILDGDVPSVIFAPAPIAQPGIEPLAHYPGQVDSVELEPNHGFVGVRWIWCEIPGVRFVNGYIKVMKWKE